MAINKKLIHFKTKQKFDEELANGNILDTSIVFIQDSKEIYTHGQYYGDLSECLTKYPQEFTKEEKDQMLENLGYYFIEWDGVSETIELSEEEYAKLKVATIPLLLFEGYFVYPSIFVPGLIIKYRIDDPDYSFIITVALTPPVLALSMEEIYIPEKTSELENDSNFISSDNLKTINGESILGEGDIIIPTKVSQLENDANYIQDNVISDGVYAVTADGKLIDYNSADATALGVALVAGEHKFMIAKSDATNGTNTTLYWGKNLYQKDVAGITNISSGADYIGEGKKYGTDFTTWSTGPVVDFNGAANTAAIIAGYTEHGVSMDARDMCTVLNTFNTSDGYNDWYVPACGQLALMYLAKTDINAALAKIGGTAFESNRYWSSSEGVASGAWRVDFSNGRVYLNDKGLSYQVRFIRDISVPKPLKERIKDLESQIGDINAALDYIINGPKLITFTINSVECQAEEGMTWREWIFSKYYNKDISLCINPSDTGTIQEQLNSTSEAVHLVTGSGMSYTPNIISNEVIINNQVYNVVANEGQ